MRAASFSRAAAYLSQPVVGVAGNIKEDRLNDREHAEIYLSYRQFPSAFMFVMATTTAFSFGEVSYMNCFPAVHPSRSGMSTEVRNGRVKPGL
jgi:hypothetical protein